MPGILITEPTDQSEFYEMKKSFVLRPTADVVYCYSYVYQNLAFTPVYISFHGTAIPLIHFPAVPFRCDMEHRKFS
jgi:hypothetical protein